MFSKSSITVCAIAQHIHTGSVKFIPTVIRRTHQNTVSKVLFSQDKSLFLLLVAAEDACPVVPKKMIPNLSIFMMMNGFLQWSQVC